MTGTCRLYIHVPVNIMIATSWSCTQNNIDINQCDHLGKSPSDKAHANGHDKIEQLLLKK